MGVFEQLGNTQKNPMQMQQAMRQEIGKISSHPGDYLKSKGFSIPDGMTDAGQITQYLIRSGQIGGGRYQQVMRMLGIGRT